MYRGWAKKLLASGLHLRYNTQAQQKTDYPGVAQLVARLVWDQDAGGSNPSTRTITGTLMISQRSFFVIGENITKKQTPKMISK